MAIIVYIDDIVIYPQAFSFELLALGKWNGGYPGPENGQEELVGSEDAPGGKAFSLLRNDEPVFEEPNHDYRPASWANVAKKTRPRPPSR